MWANSSLLPAYFVTLEKYFVSRNVIDENARFVSLSDAVSMSKKVLRYRELLLVMNPIQLLKI